jgi:hypothetical protein
LTGARRSVVPAFCILPPWLYRSSTPPRVRGAAAAHAAERDQQRAEATALLERYRAGEPGIAVGVEVLLAALGLDEDPPGAGPAV